MKRLRAVLLVGALMLAMLPAATQAQSLEQVAAKRKANIDNDIARCKLKQAGLVLPGNVAASTPEAASECNKLGPSAEVRALTALPARTRIMCPKADKTLNKVEQAVLADYLIKKNKEENKRSGNVPVPSQEILGLLACS